MKTEIDTEPSSSQEHMEKVKTMNQVIAIESIGQQEERNMQDKITMYIPGMINSAPQYSRYKCVHYKQ